MAGLIPREFIDSLIERSDIVAVVGDFVTLTKSGGSYKACCPFHNEKSPSFFVNPQKQFYHCFGCGVSGNAISFLMDGQGLNFVESVEYLAAKAGVDVPREQGERDDTKDREHKALEQSLREIHDTVNKFYRVQWKQGAQAKEAIDYVKHRSISGEIAREFELGLAPDNWDSVATLLNGYKDSVLEASGLLVKRKQAAGYYDRFRARIMFPIWDNQGRTIAFGGRVYGDEEPKYLNSPETPIFHKSKTLYALHKAREHIRRQNQVLIVEGYMDVVMLAQYGVRNVVATLGTAITADHVQTLLRLTPNICFCLDGDDAGKKAAWRGLQVVLPFMEDGRTVSFLFLSDGKDPDDVVKEIGNEGFNELADNALSLDTVFFNTFLERYDLSRLDQKAAFNKEARGLLQTLPTGAYRKLMFERLSELTGTPTVATPRVQRQDTNRINRRRTPQRSLVINIAGALVYSPDLIDEEDDWTRFINLNQEDIDVLINIVEIFNKHRPVNTAMAINALQYEGLGDYAELISVVPKLDASGIKEWFLAKMSQLEQNLLRQRFRELEQLIAEGKAGSEEAEELMALKRLQITRHPKAN